MKREFTNFCSNIKLTANQRDDAKKSMKEWLKNYITVIMKQLMMEPLNFYLVHRNLKLTQDLCRLNTVQTRNRYIVFGLASTTLIVLILQVVGLETKSPNLLSILAFTGMILTGAGLMFELYNKEDISEIKCQHRNVAEEYKILRDQFMSLIEEVMSSANSESELREKFQQLQNTYSYIGKSSPTTTGEDYSMAQKSLGLGNKNDEEFTWSDEEINKFLPTDLRNS